MTHQEAIKINEAVTHTVKGHVRAMGPVGYSSIISEVKAQTCGIDHLSDFDLSIHVDSAVNYLIKSSDIEIESCGLEVKFR